MDLSNFKMTEEKVKNLKPVIEKILSRQYQRESKFKSLTIGNVTVIADDAKN